MILFFTVAALLVAALSWPRWQRWRKEWMRQKRLATFRREFVAFYGHYMRHGSVPPGW